MKWLNLRKNKCPKCNKDFTVGLTIESNMRPAMFFHKCGFKISEEKFNKIISEMNVKELEKFTSENDEESQVG